MQTNKTSMLLYLQINANGPKYFAKLSVREIQQKTIRLRIMSFKGFVELL